MGGSKRTQVRDVMTCYPSSKEITVSIFPCIHHSQQKNEIAMCIHDMTKRILDVFYTDEDVWHVKKELEKNGIPVQINTYSLPIKRTH